MTTSEQVKCICGNPAELACTNCARKICSDINCGTDTIDGYLCGTYTQWGCSKKYTNCDECMDDKAIHEQDFIVCDGCSAAQCEGCAKETYTSCEKCEQTLCQDRGEDHECD